MSETSEESIPNEISVQPGTQQQTSNESSDSSSGSEFASSIDEDETPYIDRQVQSLATPKDELEEEFKTIELEVLAEHVEAMSASVQAAAVAAGTVELVGYQIRLTIHAAAPHLVPLFKSPILVMGQKFMTSVGEFIQNALDKEALDLIVYQLTLRHIAYVDPDTLREYSPAFISCILKTLKELLDDEVDDFTEEAWKLLLTYVGRKLIDDLYIFFTRVKLIQKSWNQLMDNLATMTQTATTTKVDEDDIDALRQQMRERHQAELEEKQRAKEKTTAAARVRAAVQGACKALKPAKEDAITAQAHKNDAKAKQAANRSMEMGTAFGTSLHFNLGVMAPNVAKEFKTAKPILAKRFSEFFDMVVRLSDDPSNMDEELWVTAVRHLKYGVVDLNEIDVFSQAAMVTLRSMLPRLWNYDVEDSWTWMLSNIGNAMRSTLSKAGSAKAIIDDSMDRIAHHDVGEIGASFYRELFSKRPEVKEHFYKPASTVAHILGRVLQMMSNVYHNPGKAAEDIRALGLRHIRYDIPVQLYLPFAEICVQTLSKYLEGYWHDTVHEAWTDLFAFVGKVMSRATTMGTNVVTRAIVKNSVEDLEVALSVAPRKDRATWALEVDVSGQRLSPFYWAIFDGKTRVAQTMLGDVLQIRADREAYYCGKDELFATHPGVVLNICHAARELLPVLLDGLMWSSRFAHNGKRRCVIYLNHIYADPNKPRYRDPAAAPLMDLVEHADPRTFNHAVVRSTMTLKWERLCASRALVRSCASFVRVLLFDLAFLDIAKPTSQMFNDSAEFEAYDTVMHALLLSASILTILYITYQTAQNIFNGLFAKIHGVPIPQVLSRWVELNRLAVSILSISLVLEAGRLVGEPAPEAFHASAPLAAVLNHLELVGLFKLSPHLATFLVELAGLREDALAAAVYLAGIIGVFAATSTIAVTPTLASHSGRKSWVQPVLELVAIISGNADVFNDEVESPAAFYNKTSLVMLAIVLLLLLLICCWGLLSTMLAAFTATLHVIDPKTMEGVVLKERAAWLVELEQSVDLAQRRRTWDQLHFGERVEFDPGDLGLAGGIGVELPSTATSSVDRIIRSAGTADPHKPWEYTKTNEFILSQKLDELREKGQAMYKLARQAARAVGSKVEGGTSGAGSMLMSKSSVHQSSSGAGQH